ncbi:hypothetical protein ACLBXM_00555 [Xanthobacteraceae bacterium A53D]
MWKGRGKFDAYGYSNGHAYIKGTNGQDKFNPKFTYKITNTGEHTDTQFQVFQVDLNDRNIGDPVMKVSGQAMNPLWQDWSTSQTVDIADYHMV